MNETKQSIEKYFEELPYNFKKAISDTPWKLLVNKIGAAHNLDAPQLTSLETETMFILYGIEDAEDYMSNLEKELNLSESIALALSNNIAKEIFEVISNKAKKLENSTSNESTLVTQAPGITPANLPMVEEGEIAHNVPHVEQKEEKPVEPAPAYKYERGKDPYHEPLV